MASEPKKTNDNDQPKAAAKAEVKAEVKSAEDATHLDPYPTGDPQDPDGREAFKAAHGYYPEDYPPELMPVPEGGEPAAARATTEKRGK